MHPPKKKVIILGRHSVRFHAALLAGVAFMVLTPFTFCRTRVQSPQRPKTGAVHSAWKKSVYKDPIKDITYIRFSLRSTDGTATLNFACQNWDDKAGHHISNADASIGTHRILDNSADADIFTRVDKEPAQLQGNGGDSVVDTLKSAILSELSIQDVIKAGKVLVELQVYQEGTEIWEFHPKPFPVGEFSEVCASGNTNEEMKASMDKFFALKSTVDCSEVENYSETVGGGYCNYATSNCVTKAAIDLCKSKK